MTDPTVCIYHAHCQDGFAAAWIVHRALGDAVRYIAADYNTPPPPGLAGEDVIIVDFSYKAPVMRELAARARSVVVLDHHASAERELAPLFDEKIIDGTFDMNLCGAMLTWHWFNDTVPPALIRAIDDRDRWQFVLPNTRQISAVLFSHPDDFTVWDLLLGRSLTEAGWAGLLHEGETLLRGHLRDINQWLPAVTRMMVIGGHRVPVANLPKPWGSEACDILCLGPFPFAAYYFDRADGFREFGLRSRGPGAMDVSRIAEAYGGGGHATASGFRRPLGWEGDDISGSGGARALSEAERPSIPVGPSCRRDAPDLFDGLVTPEQAAELFAVTKRTIRNWRRDGLMEPVMLPRGRVFYRIDDLLRLLKAGNPVGG